MIVKMILNKPFDISEFVYRKNNFTIYVINLNTSL